MFGHEDDLHDKLVKANKSIEALERGSETLRKALGIALMAMARFDHDGGQDVFQGAKKAAMEALWPRPLTALMERRRTLEEELAKVIGEMQESKLSSLFDVKGKAIQLLLACNKGQQNCHECPIISCCDNDSEAARLIRELASASDIGRNRLVEMIEAAKGVKGEVPVVEHEDRDGHLARIIGEMRGEIERLRAELEALRGASRRASDI